MSGWARKADVAFRSDTCAAVHQWLEMLGFDCCGSSACVYCNCACSGGWVRVIKAWESVDEESRGLSCSGRSVCVPFGQYRLPCDLATVSDLMFTR